MSVVKVEDIKTNVRKIIAENEDISELLSDGGVLDDQLATERDNIIENVLCKAIDRVHMAAPMNMVRDVAVECSKNSSDESLWNNDDEYCKRLPLPSDFLRLAFVRLKSWREAVYTLTEQDSAEYVQARSPFSIMRPSPRHPMVAILVDDTIEGYSTPVLEAYPTYVSEITDDSGESYEPKQYDETGCSCYYVPKSETSEVIPTGSTPYYTVNVADQCYDAVIYMIANLYFISINEADKAKLMADEVAEILNGKELFNQK